MSDFKAKMHQIQFRRERGGELRGGDEPPHLPPNTYVWIRPCDQQRDSTEGQRLVNQVASLKSVSSWPKRQLWLFWRPHSLNSTCADGLKLGSTNVTSDWPAIESDPEINSHFDLTCVGETKIGGSNRLTMDCDPDQIRARLVKRAPNQWLCWY